MEQKQQRALSRESAKRGRSDGVSQTSRKISKLEGNTLRRRASSWTLERSISLESSDQEPDLLPASLGSLKFEPDHIHTSIEGRQQQNCADMSDPIANRLPSGSLCQSPQARISTPSSSPPSSPQQFQDPLDDPPAPDELNDFAHSSANLEYRPPPCVTPRHYPIHSYPANVSLTQLPYRISCIPQTKVCEYLAIAVVRHRDIHDMVEIEYDRITKQAQIQSYEDASVLSFVKEYGAVQKILYQDYDDFPTSKKQEMVRLALCAISQIIFGISSRVRPTSNWKTKFNAFLTLIWIGGGIVNGMGMLPNAIRAHMVIDSALVQAIGYMYATMNTAEIMHDGARLVEALTDLSDDREDCFEGLERIVGMFREVLAQGRMCGGIMDPE
jgi:hypothetical protein